MKSNIKMILNTMLFVGLFWNFGYSKTTGSFHSNLTYGEKKAYFELAQQIHGKVAFTRQGRIKVIALGDIVSQDFGPGRYVRWSSDGTKLAVLVNGNVYVMDAVKNAPQTLLVSSVDNGGNCPLEFHTNGNEILYSKSGVIWAVNINTKSTRKPVACSDCNGEIGISADGNRIVWRGPAGTDGDNHLHKVDLFRGTDSLYLENCYPKGCSSNISPDGTMVMNNTQAHAGMDTHKSIMIWKFMTTGALIKEIFVPQGSSEIPDQYGDNHHWSNHNDWIAAKGHNSQGDWGESYIINVPTETTYRVTWEKYTDYPDLWVDLNYSSVETENSNASTSKNNRTGVQLLNKNGFTQLNISATGRHEFHVFNILGQLLYTQEGVGPSSFGFAFLRSGLYIIQIQTQLGTSVQKMVIVK